MTDARRTIVGPVITPPAGDLTTEHAEWCSSNLRTPGEIGYACDCGGNGGRCPTCGADGPCGWDDGTPLICKVPS